MGIERMTAEEYREYQRDARVHDRRIDLDFGASAAEAGSTFRFEAPEDIELTPAAWMLHCCLSAQDMLPCDEAAVGAECLAVLAELGAVLLEHVPEGETLKRGQLVYVTSEHKAKPRGISKGWPDWHLWRVGYWQQGVELKARERKGRHARMSREQQLACAADLYRPVWAGQHLRELIAALDAAAGFKPACDRSVGHLRTLEE